MNIMITVRHFDLSKSSKATIEEKLMKLEKLSGDLMEIHMIIEQHERRFVAELILHTRTSDLHATSKSYDMLLSIDNVLRKMKGQLRAHRGKLKEHKSRG